MSGRPWLCLTSLASARAACARDVAENVQDVGVLVYIISFILLYVCRNCGLVDIRRTCSLPNFRLWTSRVLVCSVVVLGVAKRALG